MGLLARALAPAQRISHSYAGIQAVAVGLSLLLTLFVVAQDQMPNDDGVLYLYSAELISAGDWSRALQLFNWPFYSFLIAAVHKASGLGLENAAYVLNALLQALTVYAFIAVVAAAGASRSVLLSAAALVLIYPEFNDYRSVIIRGFGYWAFSMVALLWLLKSRGGERKGYVLGWVVSLLLAALFRIEGLVLLGVFPLLLLFDSAIAPRARVVGMLSVYSALLLTGAVSLLLVALSGTDVFSLEQWNKPVQMLADFYAALSSDLAARAQILKDHFLIRYSHEYAWTIVLLSMLIILVTEVVSAVGFVYLAFAIYALTRVNTGMTAHARSVVLSLVALNLAMLAAFVVMLGFLAGRYPVGLVLLVMILSAFGVLPMYEQLRGWAQKWGRARWVSAAFALIAVFFLVDGAVTTSSGKAHVAEAAEWLRDEVGPSERVFGTNYPLLFRAGKIEFETYAALRAASREGGNLRLKKEEPFASRLASSSWTEYDYIAAPISRKNPDEQHTIDAILGSGPVKEFQSRKGDRVLIYRVPARSDQAFP